MEVGQYPQSWICKNKNVKSSRYLKKRIPQGSWGLNLLNKPSSFHFVDDFLFGFCLTDEIRERACTTDEAMRGDQQQVLAKRKSPTCWYVQSLLAVCGMPSSGWFHSPVSSWRTWCNYRRSKPASSLGWDPWCEYRQSPWNPASEKL